MEREKIVVIDFGGQYNQLVARRVRECNVYCEIYSYRAPLDKILESKPRGIILTGGPNSVYEEGAPGAGKELFETGIPVLGLCYGAQLMHTPYAISPIAAALASLVMVTGIPTIPESSLVNSMMVG